MPHRFYSLLFFLLFFSAMHSLKAQGFKIRIDSFEVQTGQDICIPVRVWGFKDVSTYQFSITWKHDVLQFKEVGQMNLPGMASVDFSILGNYILHGWAEPTGTCLTKPDSFMLFELCFTAIGAPGASTKIVAGSGGFPPGNGSAEAYTCFSQNIWTNADTGFVKIIALSGTEDTNSDVVPAFELMPNPCVSSSRIIFNAAQPSTGLIEISDPVGRTGYSEKIPVQAGENQFEIPANALKAKGLYQVSLQTEYGRSTRILVVQ